MKRRPFIASKEFAAGVATVLAGWVVARKRDSIDYRRWLAGKATVIEDILLPMPRLAKHDPETAKAIRQLLD